MKFRSRRSFSWMGCAATCLAIAIIAQHDGTRLCAEPAAEKQADKDKPAESSGEKPGEKKPAAKHKANRLATETSPYLLLHAHNPVDWYPWGEEALARAKKEGKPIFLSIGYSSCYWCHVMERESFMDAEIAKFLNEHFVCIKVDREERPDIDEIYMTSVQVLGRDGGWPLSMFLTPEAKPFFGGTYFPPRDRDDGAPGFLTVVGRVHDVWTKQNDNVKTVADRLAKAVKEALEEQRGEAAPPKIEMLADVQEQLAKYFDADQGGFTTGRTKFPSPSNLVFLLSQARSAGKANADSAAAARKMLVFTLDRMAQGGIRDHLGGGFHRYTVDAMWRIPHFEKMLYDNAQLASVYAEAFALTGNAEYRRAADELIAFVLREMTDAGGGFFAALDAETEAVEGKFYIWTREELEKTLTKNEFALFAAVYGIGDHPNFEEKYYVPQLAASRDKIAADQKKTADELEKSLAPIRAKLLSERAKRKRPLTDTKILAGWNGMMIRGLADAGRIFKNESYLKAAARAADFVLAKMRRDGRLFRTHTAGEPRLNAYTEDYALVVDGLTALHQATGDARWLAAADELTKKQIELFWDAKHGGFFFTSRDHEQLLANRKDAYDGPIPSGNSVAVGNLVYLANAVRVADAAKAKDYLDRAEKTLATLTPRLVQSPASAPRAAVSLAAFLAVSGEKKPAQAKPSKSP